MASNFQIFTFSMVNSLHLQLYGDFDGSSAHELLNTLIDNGKDFFEVFIDTNDLKTIYPFGEEVFQKKLGIFSQKFNNLIFIGENGHKIMSK